MQSVEAPGNFRGGALAYFIFALGWSSLFWTAAAATGQEVSAFPASVLFYLGGAGPPLAAIALVQLRELPEQRRDFWLRSVDVRRIQWRWLAAALLVHPALVGLAVLFLSCAALGADHLDLQQHRTPDRKDHPHLRSRGRAPHSRRRRGHGRLWSAPSVAVGAT